MSSCFFLFALYNGYNGYNVNNKSDESIKKLEKVSLEETESDPKPVEKFIEMLLKSKNTKSNPKTSER